MASVVIEQINKTMYNFSHQLVPSDEYIARGKEVANKLFNVLQQRSRFNIDRVYLSGSTGKKTAIFGSDLDCVLFVNNIDLHQIENVLDDFEDILTLSELPKLNVASIWKRKFSVKLRYDVFDVDILPAINMVVHHPERRLGNPYLGADQAFETLRKISENPSKAYHYSTALVESQLEFMKNQSSFIHDLVRISKLWNRSLFIDGRISGRSTLIELIAVYAGQREENRTSEDRSLLSAFQTFLRLIEKFPELKIEFDFDPLKPNGSLSQLKRSSPDGPTLRDSYYVIEPANPFNNIAKGPKEDQMKLFQKYASETLQRLSIYVTALSFVQIPLDSIFQPQPTIIPYISEDQQKFFQSAHYLVSTRVQEGPLCPSMVIRNEDKFKTRDMQGTLKFFQALFSVVAQGFVSSIPCNSTKSASQIRGELQERMQLCIDANVGTDREWRTSTDKHEDYEVSFTIPCGTKVGNTEHNFCVRISLKSA